MNSQTHLKELKNQFYFGFVEDDPELKKEANLRLLQLLAIAPPGSEGIGLVEKTNQFFVSTVTIQSHYRTFTAKSMGTTYKAAVKRSLERLEDEIYRWRFGNGSGSRGGRPGMPANGHLPLAKSG